MSNEPSLDSSKNSPSGAAGRPLEGLSRQYDQEAAEAMLEIAGPKRSSKSLYMGLYYLMIVIALAIIGIGGSVAMAIGYAGRANWAVGGFYFGTAILLICLAIYFKFKAQ